MLRNSCIYFREPGNDLCEKGLNYAEEQGGMRGCLMKCNGENNQCKSHTILSDEEFKRHEENVNKQIEETIKMFKTKLSKCCNAAIDESQVIKEGRHKGHGGRFCSKCKKLLFWG